MCLVCIDLLFQKVIKNDKPKKKKMVIIVIRVKEKKREMQKVVGLKDMTFYVCLNVT